MSEEYYYYIFKKPYDNLLKEELKLPAIAKIARNKFPYVLEHEDQAEVEGPFNTLYDLKRKSLILASVKLQKQRHRILKNQNIKEIKSHIFTPLDSSYEKSFIDSFLHITVGQFSKGKVKGVHFYDPDKTRIEEVVKIDNLTGVFAAKIQLYNENSDKWISKEAVTTFFPDNWSVQQLFTECDFAYRNKEHSSGKVYFSMTPSGVRVKFIIDEEKNVLTFYPVLNE